MSAKDLSKAPKRREPSAKERYASARSKSKGIHDRARKVLPGGVESNFRFLDPFPFYASHAEGSRLYDVDGHEYIDYLLSQGAILLGHRRKEIVDAVRRQVDKGANFAIPNEMVVKVAKTISNFVPSAKKVRFANSGTEATMHAIRLARGFTGKDKIAKPEGGYHGVHDYVMLGLLGPLEKMGSAKRPRAEPFSRGIPKAVQKTMTMFPYNDIESTYDILRREKDRLAAVITEPVLGNAGVLLPRDNYLGELRKICNELGILLVFDEVITGFRLGKGGAQEKYRVRPDITTWGKALGGGFQLAAFGGRKDIMDELLPNDKEWPMYTFHGGTYNAHPVSIAASAATLDLLKDGRVYSNLARTSDMLFKGMQDMLDDMHITAEVSRCGSMAHIYFDIENVRTVREANYKSNWDKLGQWCMECLVRGIMFGHPKGEKMFLSDAHTSEDVEKSLEVARAGFSSLKE